MQGLVKGCRLSHQAVLVERMRVLVHVRWMFTEYEWLLRDQLATTLSDELGIEPTEEDMEQRQAADRRVQEELEKWSELMVAIYRPRAGRGD